MTCLEVRCVRSWGILLCHLMTRIWNLAEKTKSGLVALLLCCPNCQCWPYVLTYRNKPWFEIVFYCKSQFIIRGTKHYLTENCISECWCNRFVIVITMEFCWSPANIPVNPEECWTTIGLTKVLNSPFSLSIHNQGCPVFGCQLQLTGCFGFYGFHKAKRSWMMFQSVKTLR